MTAIAFLFCMLGWCIREAERSAQLRPGSMLAPALIFTIAYVVLLGGAA